MTKMSNIELWADGAMVARGASALATLPDTPAQREACDRMFRVAAHAVEAEQRRDDAIAARDAALQEQQIAEDLVDRARKSLADTLHERLDSLGQRMDAFERRRVRAHLDSLPDPDNANPGGELSPIGPTGPLEAEERPTAGDSTDAHGEIPDPDDPTGVSLHKI
jgi:hypothetical protein